MTKPKVPEPVTCNRNHPPSVINEILSRSGTDVAAELAAYIETAVALAQGAAYAKAADICKAAADKVSGNDLLGRAMALDLEGLLRSLSPAVSLYEQAVARAIAVNDTLVWELARRVFEDASFIETHVIIQEPMQKFIDALERHVAREVGKARLEMQEGIARVFDSYGPDVPKAKEAAALVRSLSFRPSRAIPASGAGEVEAKP